MGLDGPGGSLTLCAPRSPCFSRNISLFVLLWGDFRYFTVPLLGAQYRHRGEACCREDRMTGSSDGFVLGVRRTQDLPGHRRSGP